MFLNIMKKEEPTVKELMEALREVRENKPKIQEERDNCKNELRSLHVESLSGVENGDEIRDCQLKDLAFEERLLTVQEIEGMLKEKLKAALERDRTEKLAQIEEGIKKLTKNTKAEFEVLAVKAQARLMAIQGYIIGEVQNPGFPHGKREIFQEEVEKVQKELNICGVNPIDAQIAALGVEGQNLRKVNYDHEYLESLLNG